jgi:tyrosyl-tRNA synthetase
MKNVFAVLQARGFIADKTSDEIPDLLNHPVKVYVGFDPTADSLHIGNLVAIMGLAWFQKFGHTPVAIVGGATGMIGDPSGKSVERNLLDAATINENIKGITRSLKAVLKDDVQVINNYDWFSQFNFIDFLRDVGKHFRLGSMLAKDSVKTRLNSEAGLSFTEFSYQLLQAYDFLHLYDTHQVTFQMGGSDQWGNITAGTELIRKLRGVTAQGITFPLLTRSDGKKFGKSEEGTIWLNADKLSPYDFYQYFYRMPDADVPNLLRLLTFMDLEDILQIEQKMKSVDYIPNSAQKLLAEHVTYLVHGQQGLDLALSLTDAARPGASTQLTLEVLEALFHEQEGFILTIKDLNELSITDIFVRSKLVSSKGEARRLIENQGAYLNNEPLKNPNKKLSEADLIEGMFALLQVGKKKKRVLKISQD